MKQIIVLGFLVYSTFIYGQIPTHPFPNHTVYTNNHIKPNNYSQSELDNQTKLFYEEWKKVYLKNDCGNNNEYYVFIGNGAKNVSEGQGYGMMITAFFAGYDVNAQSYFDGLYLFYKSHPSRINSGLMDWKQETCNDSPSSDDDSASDGDIDIAFALLLAHAQWGSDGTINYLEKAQIIMTAIMQDEINQNTWTVKLGDWSHSSSPNYYNSTRTSDFVIDHFKVFSCLSGNSDWNNVVEACYSLIDEMQTKYSSTTGLLPDFIINVDGAPRPAGINFLEGNHDGDYYYNACRNPWRIGTDFLINGDIRAKTTVNRINTWLMSTTNNNIFNISNGYKLDGSAVFDWNDATYIGPFAVGAMADVNNQSWLNNLYTELLEGNDLDRGDYYSNTIKLLSMITISGNYWVPECAISSINEFEKDRINLKIYPSLAKNIIKIEFDKMKIFDNKTISISSINGKVLMERNLKQNHQQIDISSLASGIYLISIVSDNRVLISQKIVKE